MHTDKQASESNLEETKMLTSWKTAVLCPILKKETERNVGITNTGNVYKEQA